MQASARQSTGESFGARAAVSAHLGWRRHRKATSDSTGTSALLAVVPSNTEAPNLLRMRPSLNGLYDYTNIALAPDRDRKVQAYLSFDIDGVSPASICYGNRVQSPRKLQALKPNTSKQVVIAPIVDRALLAQEKNLQQLLSEYEQIANAQARRDRLVGLRQLLKGKLRSLASIQTAFQSVHIPTEQLVEVVEQLERLLGPTQIATSLLLKGFSGTGKTLLAQKVSVAAGIPFTKAGVNTLKKSQSWRERCCRPRTLGDREAEQALRSLYR